MKQVIFSIMVLLAVLTACNKDETSSTATEQTISATALPLKVTEYISNNFPAESITSVVQVTNGTAAFIVSLNTLEELAFDHNGGFLGNGAYFHPGCDSLGYHSDSAGYHNDSIGTGHGGHGGHGGPGHGDQGHGGHGRPGENGPGGPGSISIDSLPAAIGEYILTYYAGYTAQHAEIKANCQFDSIYEIMLVKDTVHPVKVLFGLTGNFLMTSHRAVYANAPQVIKDYITANYAGYTGMTKMEILTMSDNTMEYAIFLEKQHSHKLVLLTADGTLICEK